MTTQEWTTEITADSPAQFLEFLSPTSEFFCWSGPGQWIYRGECDWEVPLLPTIHRPGSLERVMRIVDVREFEYHRDVSTDSELFLINVEMELLKHFIYRVDESGLAIPSYSPDVAYWLRDYTECLRDLLKSEPFSATAIGSHPLNRFANFRDDGSWPNLMINSILALARHNRMPSRLLDWSLSAPTAAYFAVKEVIALKEKGEPVPEHFSVWALSRDITGHIYDLPKPQPPEFCYIKTPSVGNLHMIAQRGVFTSRTT